MSVQFWIVAVSSALMFLLLIYVAFDWSQRRRWERHQLVTAAIRDAMALNQVGMDRVRTQGEPISAGTEMDDTETLITVARTDPLPEVRGIGLAMERALKTITGEEKATLGSRNFFEGMAHSLDLISQGMKPMLVADKVYVGLAEFVENTVSRGQGFPSSQVNANKDKFLQTLLECAGEIRKNRPGPAIKAMTEWQRKWKDRREIDGLPRHLMPLALAASEAVIDIYGEELVFDRKISNSKNKTIAALLEKTYHLMTSEPMDAQEAVALLGHWEMNEPTRPKGK